MSNEVLYNNQVISFLEELWGDGFLSPGGSNEVEKVLEGVNIKDQRVLDIGSGSGACAVLLAKSYLAKKVVGIDVEPPVCDAARNRVIEAGLSEQISIELVSPGKLPFEDGSFDVVFSKDSIIHIPDKSALASDVFRLLKPGGYFAASDWLISHGGKPSPEMSEYIKAEGLDFAMASPGEYHEALVTAGFVEIELVNRNPWYSKIAAKELEWLKGSDRQGLSKRHGKEFIDHQIEIWTKLVGVLESGEHCPHHIRAKKSLDS